MAKHRAAAFGTVLTLGLAWAAPGRADSLAWVDPGWRETKSRTEVSFDRSGVSTTVREFAFTALSQEGARAVAVQSFAYDGSVEKVVLEEAVTVKADGRVIPVDPRAVKDQPSATDTASPYFDERRVKVVAFSNVGPGDSVRGRVRTRGTRAHFPGAFAASWSRGADEPPGTMQLTVSGPADVPLRVAAHGVSDTVETANGRVIHHVTFAETAPRRSRSAADGFDDAARFEASTFPDYAAFAAALRARNAPMARPDAAVAREAAEIVGGAATVRAKAERIHAWVAENIRYVGIGLDDGGWTSQPAAAVLAAGYGDCKGHATLLKALLAAQGVAADLVLVNAGPRYALTELATPNFDHAIVYLPGLDLYLDPTARDVPFGALPSSLYGKPVLDVDAGRLAAIPPMAPDDDVLSAQTDYALLPDGTQRATSRFGGAGLGAVLGRRIGAWLATQDRGALAARKLTDAELDGSGTYDVPDVGGASASYAVTAPFTVTRAYDLAAPFSLRMLPLTDPRPGVVGLVTGGADEGDFACRAVDSTTSASLALPDGVFLDSKPADVSWTRDLVGATARGLVTGRLTLEARAWLDGRTVRLRSRLTAAFSAPLCPEAFLRGIRDAADALDTFQRVRGIGLTPEAVAFVTDEGSPFAAGLQAFRARSYAVAFMTWLPLAEAGEARAQNKVGDLYRTGLGVPEDRAEAFRWYLRAAARGDALGEAEIGYCYRMGFGVARDDARAAAWYGRAAGHGSAWAEYSLAQMHADGLVYPADLPLAALLFERAAAHGVAAGGTGLGLLYQAGRGVAEDPARALALYRRAAARGDLAAENQIGAVYALGIGVPVDYGEAAIHLRRAADGGVARAQFELGWSYENGFGVPASAPDAKLWYAKAAAQGHAEARQRLDIIGAWENPTLWSRVVGLVARLGR